MRLGGQRICAASGRRQQRGTGAEQGRARQSEGLRGKRDRDGTAGRSRRNPRGLTHAADPGGSQTRSVFYNALIYKEMSLVRYVAMIEHRCS